MSCWQVRPLGLASRPPGWTPSAPPLAPIAVPLANSSTEAVAINTNDGTIVTKGGNGTPQDQPHNQRTLGEVFIALTAVFVGKWEGWLAVHATQ